MPPRIRQQGKVRSKHTLFGVWDSFTEYMYESSYPGSCAVYHTKTQPMSWSEFTGPPWKGQVFPPNGSLAYQWTDFVPDLRPAIPASTKLNWNKLPSSTEANLLMLLAEWDETIAIFTKKFWKQLTYGSFTWGVLPFVREVEAVLRTLSNISKNIAELDYEDTYSEHFTINRKNYTEYFPYTGFIALEGELSLTYHLYGQCDYSHLQLERFLDTLGLHPDLATAWDIVPLSFVINWFFPIGSYLESLRKGGWVKAVYFNGWQSCKFEFSGTALIMPQTPEPVAYAPARIEGYTRYPHSTVLTVEPFVDDSLGIDFEKAFNTWYLLFRDKKRLNF